MREQYLQVGQFVCVRLSLLQEMCQYSDCFFFLQRVMLYSLWFVVCSFLVLMTSGAPRPLYCLFSSSPVFVEFEESSGVV
jgi:hypothetical protein